MPSTIIPGDCIVTQELIRNLDSIFYWIKHVKTEGRVPKVKLNVFRNSPNFYVQDGHTRLIACHLAGVELFDNEFEITHYSVKEYLEVNLKLGYVTPFNPITHVRYSDFFHVKQFIINQITEGRLKEEDIPKLHRLYSRPRRITYIKELSEVYKPLIESIR